MSRRSRSLVSLSLTSLALALSVLAFSTSYWCEGTHKVVKPPCLSPVKMKNCGQNNSQPYTTGKKITGRPGTLMANAVHYIWETGEDKYMLRYFHTGFWLSCEKHNQGEVCRSFIELTPGETQGVLWLSMISEFTYIGLLALGFLMMWMEVCCLCLSKEMYALKINAFAAMCTVLSGLMGMVAHMMYTTVFQMTVSMGPKDWRPQEWDYGWSFAMAWLSFSCCMAAAVATLNSYTKTLIEIRHRQRIQLEEARAASHAPSYDEVITETDGCHGDGGGSIYSVNRLLHQAQQSTLIENIWHPHGTLVMGPGGHHVSGGGMVMVGGCGTEGCEDCEREMDEMEDAQEEEYDEDDNYDEELGEREDDLC
ncbi:germ cell-specific gene 1-like protein [Sardina pilchardus]|uniref:germ cell-specific gene 1-like protein n=1 Tax=Sardina pilchardus TaxID=27697 RepID=UPI002E13EA8C